MHPRVIDLAKTAFPPSDRLRFFAGVAEACVALRAVDVPRSCPWPVCFLEVLVRRGPPATRRIGIVVGGRAVAHLERLVARGVVVASDLQSDAPR